MRVRFLDLRKQNHRYREAFIGALSSVMLGSSLVLGQEVDRFEQSFASYCKQPHCVSVGNGYDAMRIMLRAYGIGPSDEVIVATNTHIATWIAVMASGAQLVPVEPDEETMVLSSAGVESSLSVATRVVLATPLYGIPVNVEAVRSVLPPFAYVFLDAAQAHGLKGDDLADASAFSFYPTKNLGALGDGGAIVLQDELAADTARYLRNYGAKVQNQHEYIGYNSRLDELQAAFLNIKLPQLDAMNQRRRKIAAYYREQWKNQPVGLPPDAGNYHQFVLRHANRDLFRKRLDDLGVETLVHYPTPPHLQPALKRFGFERGTFPIAEKLSAQCLSVPIGPELTDEQVEFVADVVRACA